MSFQGERLELDLLSHGSLTGGGGMRDNCTLLEILNMQCSARHLMILQPSLDSDKPPETSRQLTRKPRLISGWA